MSLPVDALVSENAQLRHDVAELTEANAELSAKVAWFEEQHRLDLLRRYGPSSEKAPEGQQALIFNEAEEQAQEPPQPDEPQTEEITYRRRKSEGRRDEQLAKLPQESIVYALPASGQVCPGCSGPLHEMSEEVRREIKIVPAKVSVVNHKRIVYACRHCQKEEPTTPVITAPMPAPAFPGGIGSPSAVAYIASEKFVNGLPLYRQQQDLARRGIDLSRQTMANWMLRGAQWLLPLHDRLHAHLKRRDILHADETTVQVLREEGRAAHTKSTMWLYRTGREGPPIVLFDYQTTRAQEHPKQFLEAFRGYLHVDGYDGYNALVKPRPDTEPTEPAPVTLVGCWAHARRNFKEALDALPPAARRSNNTAADVALRYINEIFDIERELKDADAHQRYAVRERRSRPLLERFRAWLDVQVTMTLPKSRAGQALAYCLGQWTKLTAFLADGRLEIDNNRSERSIKPFVIGRKNWLFANTPRGAKASAIIYSVAQTAKENGLVPFEYLAYLFEQMPNIDTTSEAAIDRLLPWSPEVQTRCRVPANP